MSEDEGSAVDHVEAVTPRSGHVAIPGYDAAGRRMNKVGWDPAAAWRDLGLFPPEAAEDFLQGAMAAVAKADKPKDRGRVLTMVLAFALIAVEADREQRDSDVLKALLEDDERRAKLIEAISEDVTPDGQDDRPPITF